MSLKGRRDTQAVEKKNNLIKSRGRRVSIVSHESVDLSFLKVGS